jgi:hypothetical protein
MIDPKDAAREAFIAISSCPRSTEASASLFHILSPLLGERGLDHIANRLNGSAARSGREPTDDSALLAMVHTHEANGAGRASVRAVAEWAHPGNERAQLATMKRLRRKRDAE